MNCQTIPAICETRWRKVRTLYTTQPAIRAPDGSTLRTFEEVEAEARHWETMFMRIPEGSVAALDLDNHPSWPALVLAAFRSRRVLLPLDPSANENAKKRIEALCGVTVRITTGLDQLQWKFLPHCVSPPWTEPLPDFLKVSSGTTDGKPRAIRFTKNQLLADCDQICETMKLDTQDLQYGVIPFSHSYGFSSLVTPLLWRGIPLVVAQDRLPHAITAGIYSTGATVLPAIPSLFQALSTASPLPLKHCISAGAPLRPSTAKAFYETHRLKIHSFYGSSECGGICYDASDDPVPPEGFVGSPLQGVSLEWNALNSRISVRSRAVGLGYHPYSQEKDFLSGNCFLPGDLIKKCRGGFRIVGRVADWIDVGAKKIHPAEIERELLRYPGVQDAIVFGVNAGERGQHIYAILATEENISIDVLRQHCKENLCAWQIPRQIHLVRSLPTNARGKISRRALAERFTVTFEKDSVRNFYPSYNRISI